MEHSCCTTYNVSTLKWLNNTTCLRLQESTEFFIPLLIEMRREERPVYSECLRLENRSTSCSVKKKIISKIDVYF